MLLSGVVDGIPLSEIWPVDWFVGTLAVPSTTSGLPGDFVDQP